MCCRCSCCCCCCRRRLCRLRPSARNLRAPPLRSHLVGDLPVICRSSRGDVFQGFEPCALSAFLAVSLCRLVRVVRGSSVYTVKSGGGCGFCVRSFSSVVPLPRSLFGFGGAGTFSRGLNPLPLPFVFIIVSARQWSPGFALHLLCGLPAVGYCVKASASCPSFRHACCRQCPEPEEFTTL